MVHASKQHLGNIFTEQIQTKLVIVLKSMCVMVMSLDILYAGEILMIYNIRNTVLWFSFFPLMQFLLFFACCLKLGFSYYHTKKQKLRKITSPTFMKKSNHCCEHISATQSALEELNQSLYMGTVCLVIVISVSFCLKI